MIRAAVDCGTNTVRLLVLDGTRVLRRTSRIVRLGEGVDASGRLAPQALARLDAVLTEYAAHLAGHGVDRVRLCATSAVRDTADTAGREAFDALVRDRLGVVAEVLSGPQEAAYTFAGAVGGLRVGQEVAPDPVLVVDVGGGSTELVLGPRSAASGGSPPTGHSADVGAVRLTERHLRADPPTPDEIAACAADVDVALDGAERAGVDLAAARTVVGVAGTALTLAAGLTGVRDPDAVDQAVLDPDDVRGLVERVLATSVAERVETGWIAPGRADVIAGGAIVLERVLRRTGPARVVASVADVLDGMVRALDP